MDENALSVFERKAGGTGEKSMDNRAMCETAVDLNDGRAVTGVKNRIVAVNGTAGECNWGRSRDQDGKIE